MSDLLARLRAASDNEALGIGAAWALLDEAAEAIVALRTLLRECRPAIEQWMHRCYATGHDESGDGWAEVLVRLDAALGDTR